MNMEFYEESANQCFDDTWLNMSQDTLHCAPCPPPFIYFPPGIPQPFYSSLGFADTSFSLSPQEAQTSFVPNSSYTYNVTPGVPTINTSHPFTPVCFPEGPFSSIPSMACSSATTLTPVDVMTPVDRAPVPPQQDLQSDQALFTPTDPKTSKQVPKETPIAAPQFRASSTVAQRDIEDRTLLECREKGFSYAKIKKELNCSLAESTLRGRFRQLTLAPKDRERKPRWSENDLALLAQAVPFCRKPGGKPKILWESVGKWILEHGGSRKFSGKACHAKYREVTRNEY